MRARPASSVVEKDHKTAWEYYSILKLILGYFILGAGIGS